MIEYGKDGEYPKATEMDNFIDAVVKKRIDEAAAAGNTELLMRHLTDNYDKNVHSAVYRALGSVGTRESMAMLMKSAIKNEDGETQKIIIEALSEAMLAECVK